MFKFTDESGGFTIFTDNGTPIKVNVQHSKVIVIVDYF